MALSEPFEDFVTPSVNVEGAQPLVVIELSSTPTPTFIEKCRGVPGERSPARVAWKQIIVSGILAFLGIFAIAMPLHGSAGDDVFMILGSFGASAALLYGAPEAALSQPRNLVGGHVFSAIIGVAVRLFGEAIEFGVWFTAPLAVGASISFMQATQTLHPPGAATALIAVIGNQRVRDLGFMYVLTPSLVGALIMLLVAVVGNNLSGIRRYPKFWW